MAASSFKYGYSLLAIDKKECNKFLARLRKHELILKHSQIFKKVIKIFILAHFSNGFSKISFWFQKGDIKIGQNGLHWQCCLAGSS